MEEKKKQSKDELQTDQLAEQKENRKDQLKEDKAKTDKDEENGKEDDIESVKQWNFAVHLIKRISKKEYNPVKEGLSGLKDEYDIYKERKKKTLDKFLAYDTVIANSTDTVEYYILLVLSCIIATLGLLQNSAAVVIGAMIVAPLMGPILGFSAGIMWGSGRDVIEAVTTLIKGALLVLLITSLTAFLLPYVELNDQIMSRARPGLMDIVIAIASGFVGSYAYVNNKISSTIPGVAISVALMPPLCTAGIGIGIMNWTTAFGGLMLFAVNLVGISLAAVIVFYTVRLSPNAYSDEENEQLQKRFASHIAITVILLVLLSVPLTVFTVSAFKQSLDRDAIQSALYNAAGKDSLYDFEIIPGDGLYIVKAVLYDKSKTGVITTSLGSLKNVKTKLVLYSLTAEHEE